jgi:ATP phosphoribosyltransferase regulatory subunit
MLKSLKSRLKKTENVRGEFEQYMKKYNKNIPDGTADIIFGKSLYIKKAVDTFNGVYKNLNYQEIITPALEYYDAFDFANQPIAQEAMYKLSDNSGRLLVLRPDSTTPVARVVSTKLKLNNNFLKIYYNQNVFRINAGYSGKRSEIIQSGVEIIGTNGIKTDLHYIETALEILKSTGLNFKLEMGHVGFYKSIVENMQLKDEEKELVRLYIESKNTSEMDILSGEEYKIVRAIPQLFGGIEVIGEARALAQKNKKAEEILDYLQMLHNILDRAGYGEHIIIDLGIVHEIDYYTGLVIGGYVEGIGESVLSGGRYDNLIGNFGRDLPAVGFAVNINLIANALESSGRFTELQEKIAEIVHYDTEDFNSALHYVEERRQNGVKAELSCFESLHDTERYAEQNGIENVIYIKE